MEQKFTFKKLMSFVVVFAMLLSSFTFLAYADEPTNVALGKEYTISGCGVRTSYYANLTDGNAKEALSYNNDEWFGFYCNGEDQSVINAPNKVGYAIIDLEGSYDISEVKVNVVDNEGGSGISKPTYAKAYLSADGETWGEAVDLVIPEATSKGVAYSVEAPVEGTASFVKVEIGLAATFAFLNEIEVYGVEAKADDGEDDGEGDGDEPAAPTLGFDWVDAWLEVDENGIWQESKVVPAEELFDYSYAIEEEGENVNIGIKYRGTLTGTDASFGNGNGTNFRLWFKNPNTDKGWDTLMDVSYNGSEWLTELRANGEAQPYQYGYSVADKPFTVTVVETADGADVEVVLPIEVLGYEADSFKVLVSASNKVVTNYCLHSNNNASSPTKLEIWEVDGIVIGDTEENPGEGDGSEPSEPEQHDILISHVNTYTWGVYNAMVITGEGQNSTTKLGYDCTYWIAIKVDNVDGVYTVTAIEGNGETKANTAAADGFLLYAFGNDADSYAAAGLVEIGDVLLSADFDWTVSTSSETPIGTMSFGPAREDEGGEDDGENPGENPGVELPEDAIVLDYAGYVHDAYFMIVAGDNMTVAELTALGFGEAKDMNYCVVAVVGADNVITEMYTTLGRPDGVKSDVVCPEGGYLIVLNANKAGYEPLLAANVGDSIVLYNVDVDSFRGAEGNIALENAGFAIVAAETEPEETITQWESGADVDVMTDYYNGVGEVNNYSGFEDKLYGFGNSALDAAEYSFDISIYESTFNTITLYALDFASGAVMLPEEVVFVIDGVEYEAVITPNENGIATIVAKIDGSVTASDITVKAVMGASPYTFGVFNMYTEIETALVFPELPENITQWGSGANIDVMTDGYNGVGEVNNYDGFQDKLYGLSNSVLDATEYSFDIMFSGEYANVITLYALDFANGGVMLPDAVSFVIDGVYYDATITPNEAGIATITATLDEAMEIYYVTVVVEMGASPYTFPIFNMFTELELSYEAPGLPEGVTQWASGADVDVMTDGYNGVGEVNNYDGFQDKLYGFGNAGLDAITYSFDLTVEETSFDTITLYVLDFANGGVMLPGAVTFIVNGNAYDAVITGNENGVGTIVAELPEAVTASEITVLVDMAASPYTFGIFNMFTEIELTKFVPADPIDVTLVEGENEIAVPAGSTANATTNFDKDLVITIAGQWDVTVVVNGTEYYPNRMGNLEAPLPAGENTVEFKNSAEEEAPIVAVIAAPIVGDTMDDPIIIEEDSDITADVTDKYPQGVYYQYTATEDGTVTITIKTESGWSYVINNVTAGKYGDMHWSDDETVVATETIDVTAGDVIAIQVLTYDPENPWSAPVGTVEFTLDVPGEAAPETVDIALGDVNMDGKIDQYDYILVKRHYFETRLLNEVELELADVNNDDVVNQYDYILLCRHYFETFTIEGTVEVPAEAVPAE